VRGDAIPTEIVLPSCTLRPFREEDAPSLQRHANDEEVWLALRDRFPHPYMLEDARSWIEIVAGMPEGTHFAIVVSGECVGTVGIVLQTDVHRRSAEIGYWLGRAVWGRGIATEVVRAVTMHGFHSFGLVRLFANVFATNAASARVLEKAGYALEGRMRNAVVKDGVLMDALLYACVTEGGVPANVVPPTAPVPLSGPFSSSRRGRRK
jgi:[ribosomal protein S5]-alanine N-acetyltransferase